MRFFLKEYATQCVPFKTTLTTMMESAEDSQPLVRVLRSMIAKLYFVCYSHMVKIGWNKQNAITVYNIQ